MNKCKYLGLESYLPTSNRGWCRELVKVKIRNLQSLLVCLTILWRVSSIEDDWIFGWRSRLASQISYFVLVFHFSPLWTNGAALRSMNSIDAIVEDKVLKMTHLDLQKRFPKVHVCPKCLASLLCGSALQKDILPGSGWGGKDTGRLVTCEFPLRIDSASWKSFESFTTIYFILQFLYSASKFQNSILIPD